MSEHDCVWCCGCDRHPVGKPWGWNYNSWNRHFKRIHDRGPVPVVEREIVSSVEPSDAS